MKSILFVVLLLSVTVFGEDTADLSSDFQGVWQIEITQSSTNPEYSQSIETVHIIANLTRQQGQILGVIEGSNPPFQAIIQCSMTGPNSGDFYILGRSSIDDEFDSGARLFSFDFTNNTERTLVSRGIWTGLTGEKFHILPVVDHHDDIRISSNSDTEDSNDQDENTDKNNETKQVDTVAVNGQLSMELLGLPGFYQAVFTDKNLMVINVVSADGKLLTTMTATKVNAAPEAGFFSRFGTPFMFIAAMMISRLLRSFFGGGDSQQRGGGAKASAATAAKK